MMKKVSTVIFLLATIMAFGQSGTPNKDKEDSGYLTKSTVTKNDDKTYNVISETVSTTVYDTDGDPVKTNSYAKNNVSEEKLSDAVDDTQKESLENTKFLEERMPSIKAKVEEKKKKKKKKDAQVMEFPDGKSDSEQSGMITIIVVIKGSGPSISFKNIPKNGIVFNYDNLTDYKSNFNSDVSNALKKKM